MDDDHSSCSTEMVEVSDNDQDAVPADTPSLNNDGDELVAVSTAVSSSTSLVSRDLPVLSPAPGGSKGKKRALSSAPTERGKRARRVGNQKPGAGLPITQDHITKSHNICEKAAAFTANTSNSALGEEIAVLIQVMTDHGVFLPEKGKSLARSFRNTTNQFLPRAAWCDQCNEPDAFRLPCMVEAKQHSYRCLGCNVRGALLGRGAIFPCSFSAVIRQSRWKADTAVDVKEFPAGVAGPSGPSTGQDEHVVDPKAGRGDEGTAGNPIVFEDDSEGERNPATSNVIPSGSTRAVANVIPLEITVPVPPVGLIMPGLGRNVSHDT